MPITIDEIKKNDVNVRVVDLSVTPFDKNFAADLAEALKNNSTINNLSMGMSDISDDEF